MVSRAVLIPTSAADAVLAGWTGQDVEVQVHDGDPGVGGTSNAVSGLDPVVLEPEDWTSPDDDSVTSAYGGRFVANTADVEFGQATVSETARWVSLWHEGNPDGDGEGVFDTWFMNIEIEEKAYAQDEPVIFSAGELVLFVSGAYPMAEGDGDGDA